jgi:PAS domain S-box-containing protein
MKDQNYLNNFFQLSLDFFCLADFQGYFIEVNSIWTEILGYSREEMLSRPFIDFIHPDDVEQTINASEQLEYGKNVFRFTNRYRHKDGHYLWLEWYSSVSLEDKIIYAVARDISNSMKYRTHYELISKVARVGTWEIDLNSRELYWSDITHEIHGTNPKTYFPKLEDGLSFYPPESHGPLNEALQKQFADGTSFDLTLKFLTIDKNEKWVRTVSHAEMKNGKVVRTYGTFEDVTIQVDKQQSMLKTQLRLESIMSFSPSVLFECDLNKNWTISYVAPYIEVITGYPASDFINDQVRSYASIIHPEDVANVEQSIQLAVKGRHPYELRYRITHASGEVRWIWERGLYVESRQKIIGTIFDISEEVYTNETLKSLQLALDESSIIAMTDLQGKITYANNHFCEISGYSLNELIGQNHRLLNSNYHPTEFFQNLWRTITAGKTWTGQIRNRKKDGSFYWVQTLIHPIRNIHGRIDKYLSIRHEISEYKEKEIIENIVSKLRASYMEYSHTPQMFYNYLLKSLIDLTESEYGFIGEVKYKDQNCPYLKTYALTDISWNQTTRDFYSKHIDIGMEFHNLKTLFGHVMTSQKSYYTNNAPSDKFAGGLPPGHPPLIKFLGVPIFHSGKMIAMFGMANRPQGYDQKLMDLIQPIVDVISEIISIYNLEKDAADQTLKLQLLASSSELGLWDWNVKKMQVQFDQRYCEIIGYKVDEFEHNFEFWQNNLHPDDRSIALQRLNDYFSGVISVYEVKFRIRHKLGHYVPILAKGKITQRADDGTPIHIAGTHFDLSYITAMESELDDQRKIAQHQAKLASIGELAAGVGHEINNPLAIVKGFVSSINREFKHQQIHNPKVDEYFSKINTAIDRIAHIVKGLRSFSRSDTNEINYFNLQELLQESYDLIHEIYASDGVKITCQYINTKDPMILGNRGRVQQTILNLLSNARDALNNRPNKQIEITMYEQFEKIYIKVKDNGSGIPKAIQSKIFDAFFTTKEVGIGTGLGLSLVNSVMKEHEGEISFESSEGTGTIFTMIFPLKQSIPVNFQSDQVIAPTSSAKNKSSSLKVLVVDDEDDIRELLVDILNDLGHTAVDFESAEDAYNEILKNDYDLVISDIKMPGMSGIEFFKTIREMKNKQLPKLVFISGGVISMDEFKSNPDYSAADGVLPKPFMESDIVAIIDRLNTQYKPSLRRVYI